MSLLSKLRSYFKPATNNYGQKKRETLNAIGNKMGFGSCAECGDSWYWKNCDTSIYYRPSEGMFPCCSQCFKELSFERIMEYCIQRWITWSEKDGQKTTVENFPYRHIAKSISNFKLSGNARVDDCGCDKCASYKEAMDIFIERSRRIAN